MRTLLVIEDVEALPPNDVSRLFRFLERSPGNCKAIVTSRMRFDGSAIYIRAEGLSTVDAMAMMRTGAQESGNSKGESVRGCSGS